LGKYKLRKATSHTMTIVSFVLFPPLPFMRLKIATVDKPNKIACYLERIFNRDRKLKQQNMFKYQCMLHFRLHFLPDLPKFELLNLHVQGSAATF